MRIYLDNCCYNRPYDSQTSFRVSMETRAKIFIQEEIRRGVYELVSSYVLDYENSQNPDIIKRDAIKSYQDKYCIYNVPFECREALQDSISRIMAFNIAYKDASHVACAIYAECEYFLTTDIRLQRRYRGGEIIIVNPLEFIQITEGQNQNVQHI